MLIIELVDFYLLAFVALLFPQCFVDTCNMLLHVTVDFKCILIKLITKTQQLRV